MKPRRKQEKPSCLKNYGNISSGSKVNKRQDGTNDAETLWGSGDGTAVEHTPRDLEVVGSNPACCLAFFLLSFSVIRPEQGPQGGATSLTFLALEAHR